MIFKVVGLRENRPDGAYIEKFYRERLSTLKVEGLFI